MRDYFKIAVATEAAARRREVAIVDRAQLIVLMLRGDNTTARKQAEEAVERACRAEVTLEVIRAVPSREDLLTNAVARAMYEIAGVGSEAVPLATVPSSSGASVASPSRGALLYQTAAEVMEREG